MQTAERLARIALREVRTPPNSDVLRATNATAQPIPDTVETTLKFDTVTYQSNRFSPQGGSALQIRTPFVGRMTVMASFDIAAAGIRIGGIYLVRNRRTTEIGRSGPVAGNAAYYQSITVLVPSYDFEIGDQLYATVLQTSGAPLDVVSTEYSPIVCIEEIRPRVIR